MADNYTNPYKKNPFKMPAFRKYMGISFALIVLILAFVLIVWLAGGRKLNLPDNFVLLQLETPQDNAPVVVYETNLGTMKAVLYPDEAPEYYNYYTKLAESGHSGGCICLGRNKVQQPQCHRVARVGYESNRGGGFTQPLAL